VTAHNRRATLGATLLGSLAEHIDSDAIDEERRSTDQCKECETYFTDLKILSYESSG